MKRIILATLITASSSSWGNALASLYNGRQFNLNGWTLVQDADQPTDFYVMPQRFIIKSTNQIDEQTGMPESRPQVNHRIKLINGKEYSSYTIRLELDTPGQLELLKARNGLQRIAGPDARIKGMAPICGMNVEMGVTNAQPGEPNSANPNATVVKYALRSTGEKCDSIISNTDFNLEITAPMTEEPQLAQDLTSPTGFLLPNLQLILAYKYKDKVKVVVDARMAYEQLKESAGLKGGWSYVSGSVNANMTKMFQRLDIMGGLEVDCHPENTVCEQFIKQAQEILASRLLVYKSIADNNTPDSKSLIVADKEKASASIVQVDLAIDEATANTAHTFQVNFSNQTYSAVKTQTQLDLSNITPNVLDPRVRALLESKP